MTTISYNNLSLHLFKKPNQKDIFEIQENFSLHPSVISELAHPTLHPKTEFYDNHAFLVLRFPQFDKNDPHNFIASEIDFVFNKDQLIIVQYQDFEALDTLITQLRHEEETRNQFFQNNSGYLLYKIIDSLLRSLYAELDHITGKVDDVEENIFEKGKEERLLQLISFYRREATDFRRIIKPNLDVFRELNETFISMFGKDTAFYLNSAEAINARLISLIENHIETLHILHETNSTILYHKINEVIKVLTIFTAILFPLNIITSLWGMNVPLPFAENANGFLIIATIMTVSALLMVIFFRFKKWF